MMQQKRRVFQRRFTVGIAILSLAVSVGFVYQAQAKTKFGIPCNSNSSKRCEFYAVTPAGTSDRAMFKIYSQDLVRATVFPYSGLWKGTAVIRRGDVDGDGTRDFVSVPGSKGTTVTAKVWSSTDGTLKASIPVGDGTLMNGAKLGVGDIDGDGIDDIIVAARMTTGNDMIYVYSYSMTSLTYSLKTSFAASYADANVQVGELTGDTKQEVVVSPSHTIGAVEGYSWDGTKLALQTSFYPYDATFAKGVRVRIGNVMGSSMQELVTAPVSGMVPTVKVYEWNGTAFALTTSFTAAKDTLTPASLKSGLAIRLGNILGDGHLEIITAPRVSNSTALRVWMAGADGTFRTVAWKKQFGPAVDGLNLITRDAAPDRVGTGHEEILVAPRGHGSSFVEMLRYNPDVAGKLEVVHSNLVFNTKFSGEVRFDGDID